VSRLLYECRAMVLIPAEFEVKKELILPFKNWGEVFERTAVTRRIKVSGQMAFAMRNPVKISQF